MNNMFYGASGSMGVPGGVVQPPSVTPVNQRFRCDLSALSFMKAGALVETDFDRKGKNLVTGYIGEARMGRDPNEIEVFIWSNDSTADGSKGALDPKEKGFDYSWQVTLRPDDPNGYSIVIREYMSPSDWIKFHVNGQLDGNDISGVKTQKKNKIDFDSVIIEEDKKESIKSSISQLENNKKIFDTWGFGEVFEKGTAISMIFHGVPGTGKTLMAQAIADFVNQDLLIVGPAEIETSTPGGAERNIKRFFKIAEGKRGPDSDEMDDKGKPKEGKKKKHVLLFDECDSLITNRDSVGMILRGQINTLLSELERFDGIVIFTTNSIHSLDPAMERRITTKIEFCFPDKSMRKKIWMRMIPKKAPLAKDVNFDKLSEFALAGGNIKNCVLNAARMAAYSGMKAIDYDCFLQAMEKEMKGLKAFEATHNSKFGKVHGVQFAQENRGSGNEVVITDVGKGDTDIDKGDTDVDIKEPETKSETMEEVADAVPSK